MFYKVGIEGMSCFTDVEFGAFSTRNHIYNVISLAVEMFCNIHGAFRSLDLDRRIDERTYFTLILVAKSGSWCIGNC